MPHARPYSRMAYGVPWRSNTKGHDVENADRSEEIKSTKAYDTIGKSARATRMRKRRQANPTGTMTGKQPKRWSSRQPTAPAGAGPDIAER